MKSILAIVSLLVAASTIPAQETKPAPKLDPKWRALVGDWSGEGEGKPGAGAGTSSFHFDLQEQVLVCRGHSEYPAAAGRPATVHDDLMVIYPGTGADQSRAMYFDNEGHVIEYSATWAGDILTFVSKPSATAPQFRLIYTKIDAQTLGISFEMAPPGKAGAFNPYLSGRLRRTSKP